MAVLAAIGVDWGWLVSAVLGIGSVAGGIVARSWLGFALGTVLGSIGAVAAIIAAACYNLLGVDWPMQQVNVIAERIFLTSIIEAVRGIVGGLTARYHAEG